MIRPAIVLFVFFTLLTGVAYPLSLTLLGSSHRGPVGVVSDGPREFWSRPSTATPTASSGSNRGPTNPAFLALVKERVAKIRAAHPTQTGLVPADLVTMSGSGLDPHISVAGARYQIDRIAAARGTTRERLELLIDQHTEPRFLGIFGEPRVNVSELNASLE